MSFVHAVRTSCCLALILRRCITSLVAVMIFAAFADAADPRIEFFETKIRPVLIERCFGCHSGQKGEREGGLSLDSRDDLLAGGDSGPAVVPGDAGNSRLFAAITAAEDSMPPDGRLSSDVIEDFRRWIVDGAIDPREPADVPTIRDPDYSEARKYWAFQPIRSPDVPQVSDQQWPRTRTDHFVLAKLEANGLSPSNRAAPEALIRRVYFDLTGLPPSPSAVDAFVRDPSQSAYRALVDRLLDSPRYGERWAQHWLDVVRYAETEGFEYDRELPDIWRYRDYVIDSLNEDKPYDQFLTEQLAGDEIDPDDPTLRIAAGFHRLGVVRRNAGNQKVASSRNEVLTERTDIIGSAILGLTLGCARCHDHKFDPIPQQDYYRLQAFLAATREADVSIGDPAEQAQAAALTEKLETKIAELKASLAELSGPEEQRVRDEIKQLESQLPPPGPTLCSIQNDSEKLEPTFLLRRGDPELRGPQLGMRLPGVLVRDGQPEFPYDAPHPRTRLAIALTDRSHPLTPRVIVNRIWQQHFGTGLVSTANDFGKNGSPPSHPELLDDLASQFVAGGWRLKSLHREIVTSNTYQQASLARAASPAHETDPDNTMLWSFPRRRLSSEEIRDAMLAISGRLNLQMGGRSVILPVEQELVDQLYKPSQWKVSERPEQHFRRSIYLISKRNLRLPFM